MRKRNKLSTADLSTLSLDERAFNVLAELARGGVSREELSPKRLLDTLSRWSTDETTGSDEDIAGEDMLELSNFVVSHIVAHAQFTDQMLVIRELSERIKVADIDGEKLADQDQEEWAKLKNILTNPDAVNASLPEDFTIDDILGAENEVGLGGDLTPEERHRKTSIEGITIQAEHNAIIARYFKACIARDEGEAHAIIDQLGCGLTHAITTLFLAWVSTRSQLPESTSLPEWVDELESFTNHIMEMDDDDKVRMAEEIQEHYHEDDTDDGF